MGSSGVLGKGSSNGLSVLNQSTGSIGIQQNSVSVHHASPASPTFSNQQSVMTLPVNALSSNVSLFLIVSESVYPLPKHIQQVLLDVLLSENIH